MASQPSPKSQTRTNPQEASEEYRFPGFKNLNSTPIPDEFFDLLAARLSEAELRVLLYIMRRTFGFKKKADAISLSQLTGGIRKRDGAILDLGTGLSKPAVLKAINSLEAKGIIVTEKRFGYDGRNEVTVYQLCFVQDEAQSYSEKPQFQADDYSGYEYSSPKKDPFPSPDPRFVSAQATVEPIPGSNRLWLEQRLAEVNRLEETHSKQPFATVQPIYQNRRGERSLPGGKAERIESKATLPARVKPIDPESKNNQTRGVNLLDQQHGSLQESRKQMTEQQMLLRASGALALQEEVQTEPVEVEIDGDLLYVNFRKLVLALVELGLSQKLANDLAYAYPEEYLWEKITLTRQIAGRDSHQRTLRNVAGYLRRAIEEDYQPQPSRRLQAAHSGLRRFPTVLAQLASSASQTFSNQSFSAENAETIEKNYPEQDAPLPPTRRPGLYSQAVTGVPLPEEAKASSGGTEYRGGPSGGAWGQEAPLPKNAGYSISQAEVDLWEAVLEDLAGRYRLGATLDLLEGSRLRLIESENVSENGDGSRKAVVRLAAVWQMRELGAAARSAIGLALRQRLGPGYVTIFQSD